MHVRLRFTSAQGRQAGPCAEKNCRRSMGDQGPAPINLRGLRLHTRWVSASLLCIYTSFNIPWMLNRCLRQAYNRLTFTSRGFNWSRNITASAWYFHVAAQRQRFGIRAGTIVYRSISGVPKTVISTEAICSSLGSVKGDKVFVLFLLLLLSGPMFRPRF